MKVYREEFKPTQQGQIGITLNGDWVEPWDANEALDVEACERKLEFSIAWFADPVYHGDYPESKQNQGVGKTKTAILTRIALKVCVANWVTDSPHSLRPSGPSCRAQMISMVSETTT